MYIFSVVHPLQATAFLVVGPDRRKTTKRNASLPPTPAFTNPGTTLHREAHRPPRHHPGRRKRLLLPDETHSTTRLGASRTKPSAPPESMAPSWKPCTVSRSLPRAGALKLTCKTRRLSWKPPSLPRLPPLPAPQGLIESPRAPRHRRAPPARRHRRRNGRQVRSRTGFGGLEPIDEGRSRHERRPLGQPSQPPPLPLSPEHPRCVS